MGRSTARARGGAAVAAGPSRGGGGPAGGSKQAPAPAIQKRDQGSAPSPQGATGTIDNTSTSPLKQQGKGRGSVPDVSPAGPVASASAPAKEAEKHAKKPPGVDVHPERPDTPADMGLFLDEEVLMAQSTFPISPQELISKAKQILSKGVHHCQEQLADDFVFTAPFIGPYTKQQFADNMETLSLDDAFPDLQPRIYNFWVDPLESSRVWFTTRPVGHHLGYLRAGLPLPMAPTGKLVELPPQMSSLQFNEEGQVIGFTMGYVMDRRLGNTGGLGGAFGLLHALGVDFPYPEGKPWQSSWQQMVFTRGGAIGKAAMFILDRATSLALPNWLLTAHNRNVP